jgi:hypothetical protein
LQKKPRGLVKDNFEFRTSKNGTRFVTREMADFSAVKTYFTRENLSIYTFFSKSLKPVKAVIRNLPSVKCLLPEEQKKRAPNQKSFLSSSSPYPGQRSRWRYSSSRASVILQLKLRLTEIGMGLRSVKIVRSLAMTGQTAASVLVACGVVAATCTKTARRRKTSVPLRAAAIAN